MSERNFNYFIIKHFYMNELKLDLKGKKNVALFCVVIGVVKG